MPQRARIAWYQAPFKIWNFGGTELSNFVDNFARGGFTTTSIIEISDNIQGYRNMFSSHTKALRVNLKQFLGGSPALTFPPKAKSRLAGSREKTCGFKIYLFPQYSTERVSPRENNIKCSGLFSHQFLQCIDPANLQKGINARQAWQKQMRSIQISNR